MRIMLDLRTKDWFYSVPQAGAAEGWSAWAPLGREDALDIIERGFAIEYAAVPSSKGSRQLPSAQD